METSLIKLKKEEIAQLSDFEQHLAAVMPIVMRSRQAVKIRLWDYDDYLQEAMIALYEVLENGCRRSALFVHFKVRYKQHLLDALRRSNAKRRGFDWLQCCDIAEFAEIIYDTQNATPEQNVVYNSLLTEVMQRLTPTYRAMLDRQLCGETLPRRERYCLREKIRAILFDLDGDTFA